MKPLIKSKFSEIIEDTHSVSDIEKIIKTQAELNETILSLLKNNTAKDLKTKEINSLNNNFYSTYNQESNLNYNIPEKKLILKDKFNKFKNIIATMHSYLDPNIIFRNPTKPDWYEVGYKLGLNIKQTNDNISDIFLKTISFFNSSAKKVNLLTETVKDYFYLIGDKKNVLKLNKKFKKILDLLNLNSTELIHINNIEKNIDENSLILKISDSFKKLSIVKTDNEYTFPILNGLTTDLQYDMLKNILLPKILINIQESMKINSDIQKMYTNNKYTNIVLDFSEKNRFNPDLVVHSLKNNIELFEGYIGVDYLVKNSKKIIENSDKYSKFIDNNLLYLQELLKIVDKIEETINLLNISEDQKQTFNKYLKDFIVFEKNDLKINLNDVKENTNNIIKKDLLTKNIQKNKIPSIAAI